MGIELWTLFFVAIVYLGVLFLIAYSADTGWLPKTIIDHPAVYALSLGVYATSWTFYGSVGLAAENGLAFLTIYLGVTGAFLLGPYILRPILRLCRDYQLASIADLFAFRFGGRATGFMVTMFMLIGILPYISLQIRAVTESIQVISSEAPPDQLALVFCLLITVFAILFGARHLTPREKHRGLVAAIAFESAVKLIALVVAGLFAIMQVFGGFGGLSQWVAENPDKLDNLYKPSDSSLWTTLLLLAFCAAFLLPRQYHMTFVENEKPASLNTAYWLFPLYLLLLNLPIIPILWAGQHLSLTTAPDFYVLGMTLTLNNQWLSLLTFIGGVSAASAMMIVTSLALSYMCLNHLFLPASISATRPDTNLYQRILWSKRIIIAAIFAAGYGFFIVIERNQGLASLGLISFVAAAQLLPGTVGLLFWQRATQLGFILGLFGGAAVWFVLLVLPLLTDTATIASVERLVSRLGFIDTDIWSLSTFCSLSVNSLLFIVGSLLARQSTEEREAAEACASGAVQPLYGSVIANSTVQLTDELAQLLGREAAEQEIERALSETGLSAQAISRGEFRLLHQRLERNLSGLLGPTVARLILRGSLQPNASADLALTESLQFMETRLETSRQEMRGMTRELDTLRRYLRNVLQELPLGVCSIGPNNEVLIWNTAMQTISGVTDRQATSGPLQELPAPWNELLGQFSSSDKPHLFKRQAMIGERVASFNFHKSEISGSLDRTDVLTGQVILVEDRTNLDTLESELAHSERLASIGRLAAGVAHEIGNPLTGIASIAQNLNVENEHDEIREHSGDILDQVKRINAIVKSLLTFSHSDNVIGEQREVVNLNDCINEAIRLVQLSHEARQIQINVNLHDNLRILANPQQMSQVFVNLLNNACDASQSGDPVEIYGRRTGDKILITIRDYGVGIPEANRSRIFEPFFTTKAVGQGTGLGLPLVYSLITDHQGKITLTPVTGAGSCFELELPTANVNDTMQT